ncbi:GntR family transcriptional regulator [Tomitella biformata]|uniref:GntR family transcriptional regulator n=1 Tax=Tomitella biformata TaxID=630403 RepID=UPI0004666447|nr:GntR family transcriptional regulator [Tomitella biformata]
MLDGDKPIFQQVAELIENSVIDGSLAEEAQAPSTNELALFHRINPATAGKGLNQLVAEGILYKRRGIGMFVATGARETLRVRRRKSFVAEFLQPTVVEARKLGITAADLKTLLDGIENNSGTTEEGQS